MKHITKILAVVMAVVFLSGQVVYAYELDRKIGSRSFPAATNTTATGLVTQGIKAGAALTSGNVTGGDVTETKLPKPIKVLRNLAIGAFAPAGLIIATKNPDLRQKIIEGLGKIGKHLVTPLRRHPSLGAAKGAAMGAALGALRLGAATGAAGLGAFTGAGNITASDVLKNSGKNVFKSWRP